MPIETADEALDMNNLTDDWKGGAGTISGFAPSRQDPVLQDLVLQDLVLQDPGRCL